MSTRIRKVAVLGAGVMGSGIAAHLSSCGFRTIMLDIVPPNLGDDEKDDPEARNRFAASSLQGALKARPAVFVDKAAAKLIEIGNFEDDMARIADCDLVIEVVKEDMRIKKIVLEQVEKYWKPGTIVATNTSGLSIAGMLEGRSQAFKEHFLGTHFFNPVRYMHLVEIIAGPATKPEVIEAATDFARTYLGKGIVNAKDTPNFIANRIGVYAMLTTISGMKELGYTIEEVDAIVGRPMGRPKSAAFRTADMVGLDTFMHVAQNCYDTLVDDPQRAVFEPPAFLKTMVEKGILGNKTKGGFYRKVGKEISVLDLDTFEYQPKQKPDMPELKKLKGKDLGKRLKELVEGDTRAGKFAWHVLSRTLAYTANIAFDIADDVVNIDAAMRWGFNWDQGPFEAWQALGVQETADRIRADGLELPGWIDEAIAAGGFYPESKDGAPAYFDKKRGVTALPRIPGSLSLADVKREKGVIEKNRGATLLDIGDGIACLEFHTKMNTIDADLGAMIVTACDVVERDFDGLVIANEGEHFSAGANVMMVLMLANQQKWDDIDAMVKGLQDSLQRLRYMSRPTVTNPHGLTLGGGAEIAMAADRMVVAQETYMGLVEVGVGLVPGGGGHLRMIERVLANVPAKATVDRLPLIQRAFEAIGMAKVATGAGEVFELGFGRAQDEIAYNRDRRIAEAKKLCRYLADRGYTPPLPPDNLVLPGRHGEAAIKSFVFGMMQGDFISEHDRKIGDKVAHILCGGDTDGRTPVTEQQLLDLEREAFLSLVGEQKTKERIQYMLTNNKPLRN